MNKKIGFILIVLAIIIFGVITICIFLINSKFENKKSVGQYDLNNYLDENIKIVTTFSSENVISPNKEDINERENNKEEYIIKDNNGYIAIYIIDENKNEKLIKMTNIVISYLPEVDQNEIYKGIRVFGKDSLNKRLEDYE